MSDKPSRITIPLYGNKFIRYYSGLNELVLVEVIYLVNKKM